MAKRPLTVGKHGEMAWTAAHSAGGTEFADRLRPFAGPVGNQSDGFPDDADPAASGPSCPRMPPGGFRFLVGQCAGRDEVRGDPIGTLFAQSPQIAANFEVQLVGRGPIGQIRPLLADVLFAPTRAALRFAPQVSGTFSIVGSCWAGPSGRRSRTPVVVVLSIT